ncbi:MAG: immunoglobulin domain-containing protein [Bacteroidales bacterium]|nr:immunoglobulin domain-containing protein [Bacteroidales bacterium]
MFSVNRGYNEFRWVYSKDKSVNTGSDAAWIDNIGFPAKATGLLTYQWYKNNSLINNSTNSFYNVGETGNYYVRVNNNCNTFNSGQLSIEVYQKPEATITYQGNAEICEGKNLMLDANIKQKENFETADFKKYNWQHTGALNWNIYNLNNKINLGYYAAKSGSITHNQTSELSLILNVTEADSISFYRKVSSETNYDYLKFYINDVKLAEWSGEVDWAKVAFAVNPGLNTFKWVYSKDNSVNKDEDAAFIDNIVFPIFVSTGKPSYQWFKDGNIIQGATYYQYLAFNTGTYSVQVTNNCGSKLSESLNIGLFNPNVSISTSGSVNLCLGASVLLLGVNYTDVGYQWKINNNDIPDVSNSSFLAEKQGDYSYELTNSNGCSKVSDILPVRLNKVPVLNINSQGGTLFCEGSNILLKAKSIDKEDFETANLNSYSWLSNGNALWITDNSSYYSGKWSAKSGIITHLQTTSLSITLNVIANDTISFYRKVSSEKNYDFIRFYINDVLKGEWSGELDWTKFSYPVSSGITSFKWVYSKDKSVNKYSDAAWIDNVIFPHFESANQVYYQWVLNNEDIPAATNSIYNPLTSGIYKLKAYNFCGEYLTNEIKILSGQVPIAQISADGITNFCSDASVILNGTLPENENFETSDFSKYNWQHSEILQWSVTNLNSIENNYCVKSGAITHNQTSELTINFNTLIADSISFYRKISSESSYDFLRFYINDIKAGEWSGEINWSRVVFSVSPGDNTFKWIYSKDKSVNTGLDCAWIDKIIFPTQQAEKLKYQWTRNSFDIAGATNYFYNAKQAGIYNVKVSNNCGISTSSSIIVSVSSVPQITINATGSLSFCVGGSVNLFCQNSGLNSPQYQWLRNGVNINGATGSSYTANSSGIYTLNVVSASCSSLSNSQTVTVVTTPEIKVYSQGTTVCNGSLVKLTSKPIAVEDFNSNNFNKFNWYFEGNQPWRLSSTTPYEGKYNAKSGTITHNQNTELFLNYDVLANDTISFYIKVSSESNYDFAKFYINNELKGQWSGTMDYTLIKIPVNSGNNTFKWLYSKDRSVSTGSDCIWLDKINFPAPALSVPYSYQWQLNGTNINGATNSVYNANIGGSYSVVLNNLCTFAKSSSINITSNCKILSLTDNNIFKYMVYVDNVNNLLNINLSSDLQEKLSIKIYNSLGKICYQDENIIFSNSYNKVVNISNYAKGIYNVNIYRGDKVYCCKLIF